MLNGKDDNLRRADFRTLATTAGLRATDADKSIDHMLQNVRRAIDSIALPKAISPIADGHKIVDEMLGICRARIDAFDEKR